MAVAPPRPEDGKRGTYNAQTSLWLVGRLTLADRIRIPLSPVVMVLACSFLFFSEWDGCCKTSQTRQSFECLNGLGWSERTASCEGQQVCYVLHEGFS